MKSSEQSSKASKTPRQFAAPEDILVDRDLAGQERLRLLDDWKLELELLATATDENMPDQKNGQSGRVQPEELLRRVNACRRLLNEQEH
jgi:hypothetical protein